MFEGLMPTYITTKENAKNQELTKSAHFAQVSDELNLQIGLETKKSSMGKLIPVQEIQVDPCGNGWGKLTLRQTVLHLHFFKSKIQKVCIFQLTKQRMDFFYL